MLTNQQKQDLTRIEFLIIASEKLMSPALSKPKRTELANLICDAYSLRARLLVRSGEPYTSLELNRSEENTIVLPLENNTTTDSDNLKNISPNNGDLWQYHGEGNNEAPHTNNKTRSNHLMKSNIIKSWNGRTIRIRSDRYVSLTDMAQATEKRVNNWLRSDSTKSYLEKLLIVTLKSATELVQVIQGGDPQNQGTWGHPKVALRFAQWCSDEFAVQVDYWIDELLTTGRVDLNNSKGLDFSQMPQTFLELAQAWVGQMQTNQRLLAEIETIKERNAFLEEEASFANSCTRDYSDRHDEVVEELKTLRPLAQGYRDCINLDEWITGSELARRLSRNLKSNKFGAPTLYSILRENGALIKYEGSDMNLPSELWASKGLIKFDTAPLFSPKGCIQSLIIFKQEKYADRFPELREEQIDPAAQVSSLSFLD